MYHYFDLLTLCPTYSNLVAMLPMNQGKWQEESDISLLCQFAIESALSSNWTDAVKINEKILKSDPANVEALNRLARAYCLQGLNAKAGKTYQKVLGIDPYNTIAKRNLEKISKLAPGSKNGKPDVHSNDSTATITQNLSAVFVFEPGKTKVINLLNLASPSVLATLNCGEKVSFVPKKHSITITKDDGTYLGALPDDLSFKLIAFISGGNKYETYVKYATTKSLAIFIRETERSSKFTNQPSFAQTQSEKDN